MIIFFLLFLVALIAIIIMVDRPFGVKFLGGQAILSGIWGILVVFSENIKNVLGLNYVNKTMFFAVFIASIAYIWWGYAFLNLQKKSWYIGMVFYLLGIIVFIGHLLINQSEIIYLEPLEKAKLLVPFVIQVFFFFYIVTIKPYFDK